jgi:flagellar hook-associated protein 3 FlgL
MNAMRITSASAYDSSVNTLQRRQQALSEAQAQLTSGKRVLKASDDPAAAARAERAMASIARSDAQARALDASRNAMQLSESALGNAGELMQQARELLVAAGNGSYTDTERRTVAEALRGLRRDLLAVSNRSDGAGRYLFGGQGSDGAPLADTPTGVAYNGSTGQTLAAGGESTPLSIDGRAAWLEAPDPANPGNDLSLFDVMDSVIGELLTPNRTADDVSQTVREGLRDFDAVSDNLLRWRARAGEALNRLDGLGERLAQGKLAAQEDRSEAEDLDMVQAISDFQNQQSGYDAALKTYSIVQRMSLFEYLR